MLAEVIAKFTSRQAHVAVIGLGYVGLPLAVILAEAGYRVTGIDLDESKVASINRGQSYIEDVPSERLRMVSGDRGSGSGNQPSGSAESPITSRQSPISNPQSLFTATTDYSVLAECDAVSICVPTPLNKTGDPDIAYIVAASEQIARYLHPGMVVILESTTYPGTTTEVVLPILVKSDWGSGIRDKESNHPDPQSPISNPQSPAPGSDFFLAFSPERVDPGRTDWTTRNTPKVIGGVTEACLQAACAYYGQAMERLVPVSSTEAAELTKLFENTFRSVNIGLANELLLMCDKLGLDAWEVIDAAASKPFGFMKFTPGPGLGGHCIPIDPEYLSWKMRTLRYKTRFIELASEINTEMPRYWVQKVQDALNDMGKAVKGSRVLVLGVAYKKNVSDMRESPALDIIHLLEEKGALVDYHDPHVPSFQADGLHKSCVADLDAALRGADCVVVATDHSVYDWRAIGSQARLVVDTRHVIH
ncbi:MAG: nucleotide sugar dehydrogenase [Caldilineaceae bacterium]|nr:nucleotide sugar dehydrogenase [Caldilineaceae bacterium]